MRPQLWCVPLQHGAHAVILHPCEARRRIDLRREVGGVEAVALEAARRHQDEDAERGVGESETRRRRLAMQADQEIDLLDRCVHSRELALPGGIRGELGEALRHPHAEIAAERAIARYATLAITQDSACRGR